MTSQRALEVQSGVPFSLPEDLAARIESGWDDNRRLVRITLDVDHRVSGQIEIYEVELDEISESKWIPFGPVRGTWVLDEAGVRFEDIPWTIGIGIESFHSQDTVSAVIIIDGDRYVGEAEPDIVDHGIRDVYFNSWKQPHTGEYSDLTVPPDAAMLLKRLRFEIQG